MLLDIECNKSPHSRFGIERIQIQPVILKSAPEALHKRVGLGDIDLRKYTFEYSTDQELVNSFVDVLDSTVG